MEMFTAAAGNRGKAAPAAEAVKPAGDDTRAELAELKAQLAALQTKLDKLGD
jgi:polyhydroxyalkanoate synthesis regulator protein